MACSVAPALPLEMFHRVGAGGFARVVSKPRHRRTGAIVFAGTDDEVAEVLLPAAVPDSEVVPHEETRDLAAGGLAGVVSKAGKARHRRASPVFAGTDDEVAEVLRRPAEDEDEAAAAAKMAKRRWDGETEETIVAPPPWLPTGVLGEPPESLARSGPDITAAFLASVIAAGDAASSDTPAGERELLAARWTERKEASSRRARYLRDYCPFQREEESEPETTTTPLPDHAEEAEATVKTGLALDSAESEAEFVTAIRSRYLLKDGFVSRCAAQEPPAGGPAELLCRV
ncbi:unnamed protein product [Urochloa humidicola]